MNIDRSVIAAAYSYAYGYSYSYYRYYGVLKANNTER